jgi:hypothetical protein
LDQVGKSTGRQVAALRGGVPTPPREPRGRQNAAKVAKVAYTTAQKLHSDKYIWRKSCIFA